MPGDIWLDHPGTIAVAAGETLAGSITLNTDSATIDNSGLISGTISLRHSGSFVIENHAGAVIRGGTPISQDFPSSLTLTNAGTIAGESGTAIDLPWPGDNLIKALPGGVFIGQVNSAGTLELAAGAGTGTIDRLGIRFTGFSDIVIDAGADWVIGKVSTIGPGMRLTNAGRLTELGTMVVLCDFGGDGTLALGRSATVAVTGTLAASRVVFAAGGGQTLRLGAPQGFTGRIDGFKAGETIDLGGIGAASLAGFAGGQATLAGPGGTITLALSGSFDPAGFFVVPDGNGGSALTYGAPAILPSSKTIAAGAFYASGYAATLGTLVNHGTIAGSGVAGGLELPLHLDNDGTIAGSANGVRLPIGGSVTNRAGGSISGGTGIYAMQSAIIANAGFIGGTALAGISLVAGGRIDNLAGGTIDGDVTFANAAITLTNAGYVDGRIFEDDFTNPNVATITGVRITNQAGATITGGFGADAPGVVLDNAGMFGSNAAYSRWRSGGTLINHASGTFKGTSLRASGPLTLLNEGWIDAGVFATSGGTVVNGGTIAGVGFSQERLQGTETNVTNFGFIAGVHLTRSMLVNAAGGTIAHYSNGGVAELASTIVNAGLIAESPYPGAQATSEMVGAKLVGGRLDNRDTGTISGFAGVFATYGATVVNAGTIIGTGGTAVSFSPSNDNRNRLEIAPGAVFIGTADGGAARYGAAPSTLGLIGTGGTLHGFGSGFIRFPRVEVAAGASWALGDRTLPAWATLANAGTLTVPVALYSQAMISGGLSLAAGAALVNGRGGMITAAGTAVSGIGGRVTNLAGALIQGRVGIQIAGQPGTIANSGTVAGTGTGILLAAGGLVQNRAGATISGAAGIRVTAGAATIINAGAILAPNSSAPAIRFADADGNRLVVLPGSTIAGQVQGGAGSDTLELGTGIGTVAWLGAHYTGFETLVVRPGAQWRMAGMNTLAGNATLAVSAGSTLSVAGTLRVAGDIGTTRLGTLTALPTGAVVIGSAPASAGAITVSAGQHIAGIGALKATTIIDAGTITASGGAMRLLGNVSGPGTVAIDAQSIMAIHGTLSLPRITFLPGDHQTLLLGSPASVSGTIDGFGTTDMIDLHGIGLATGTSFSGDTLSVAAPAGAITLHFAGPYQGSHFAIADDGQGGTSLTYS